MEAARDPYGCPTELHPAVGKELGVLGQEPGNTLVSKTLRLPAQEALCLKVLWYWKIQWFINGGCHMAEPAGTAKRTSSILEARAGVGAPTGMS